MNRRRWGTALCAALLGLVLTRPWAEDARKPSERVVTGEVVDLSCYLMLGARGEAHRGCAEACLAHGGSAAILTDDGQIILPLYDPKAAVRVDLAPYVAQRVQARGTAYSKGGITGIALTGVTLVPEEKAKPSPEPRKEGPLEPSPKPERK